MTSTTIALTLEVYKIMLTIKHIIESENKKSISFSDATKRAGLFYLKYKSKIKEE